MRYFARSFIADEMFFDSLIPSIRLPYENDELAYCTFPGSHTRPNVMTSLDLEPITASGKAFARKFDERVDDRVDDRVLDILDLRANVSHSPAS